MEGEESSLAEKKEESRPGDWKFRQVSEGGCMGVSMCGNLRASVHVSVSEGALRMFVCEWVSIYVCVFSPSGKRMGYG